MAEFAAADGIGPARKVVLIDFWTYTCINWLRTLPYVARLGREIQGSRIGGDRRPCAGVRFLKEHLRNVRWAVKEMRVDYPVAVDNEHVIWRAFKNQYWPALYFVDPQGVFDIIILARAHTNGRK